MSLWRKKPETYLFAADGFHRGQVVQHKISAARVVICWFKDDPDGMTAYVSYGFKQTDGFECYTAELKPEVAEGAISAPPPEAP